MASDSQPKECAVCGEPARNLCSRCRGRRYCSREHQAQDWPQHKQHCVAPRPAIDFSGVAQHPDQWDFEESFKYCAPMTLLHVLDLACHTDPPLLPPHKLPRNVEELTVHFAGANSDFEPRGEYEQVLRRLPRLRRLNIVFQGFLPRRRRGYEEDDSAPTRHGKPQQKQLADGRVLTTVCFGNGQFYHEFVRACANSREHAAFAKPDIVFIHNPGLDQYLDQWSPSITELIRMRVLTVLTGYSKDASRICHPRIMRRYGAKEVLFIRDNRFAFPTPAGIYKSHNLMAVKGPREEYEAAGGECVLPTDYDNMMIELCEKEGVELQPQWLMARGLHHLIPASAYRPDVQIDLKKPQQKKDKKSKKKTEQKEGPDFSQLDLSSMSQFMTEFMKVDLDKVGAEGVNVQGVHISRDPRTGAMRMVGSK